MIGPGTIESPVVSADQCHTSCAHRTRDSSIAPNAIENSNATAEAPVNGRTPNSERSISGLWWRAVRSANSDSRTSASTSTPTVRELPQPHEPPSTSPSVSEPTPPVISSALSEIRHRDRMTRYLGQHPPAGDQRGDPDRHVHQEHPPPARGDEQTADGRSERGRDPADRGPRPDRAMAALGRERRQDQPERGRRQQRRAGRLDHTEGDEHGQAGRGARTPPRRPRRSPPRAESRARGGSGRRGGRTARAATRTRSRSRSAPRRGRRGRWSPKLRAICGSATLTMNRSRLASTTPAQTITRTRLGEAAEARCDSGPLAGPDLERA